MGLEKVATAQTGVEQKASGEEMEESSVGAREVEVGAEAETANSGQSRCPTE